jgi:tetratricopeptide (TPR) repeat protein
MASTRPPRTREGVLVTELRRRAARRAATLIVSVLATASLSAMSPAIGRDEWRRQAAEARRLAENDARRAYELAKRLDAEIPADATPADRALALNLLARIELYLAMTDRAAEHAGAALALADQHGDRIGQAEALLTQAINSINQGDLPALIASASRSLTVVEGVARPDLVSEAFLRTSMMYRRVGKIEESVEVAMRGMEMAKRSKDPLALIYAHQGLGISFDQSFRYAEARTHYATMLDLARKVGYRLQQGYATGSLGGVLANLGDPREGERLIRDAIDHYRAVGAPFAVAFGLSNLAYALRGQKRYAEALAINHEVVATYERHSNRIGLWYALNFRSENLLSLGQPAPARADVERARAVAQKIGLPTYTSESARRLASLTAAAGDHQRAYALSVEAHDITTAAARETAG